MTGWPKSRLLRWLSLAIVAGVCAAQTPPPNLTPAPLPAPQLPPAPPEASTDPTAATVVTLVGDVSVLKDSYPWILNVGDTVKVRQVIISGPESYAVFRLSDGSQFQVFPNSRVTFRNNPSDWRDLLDVWLGKVKVYIQKLGDQPNPHRIFTPTAVISVRGTVFEVAVEDEADTTLVAVDEGQVSVRHRLIGESNEKILNPGEYIRVYKDVPLAKSVIDKTELIQRAGRALTDVIYIIVTRTGGGGGVPGAGGGASGGPTLPGDTGSTGGDTPPAPGENTPPVGAPPPPPGN